MHPALYSLTLSIDEPSIAQVDAIKSTVSASKVVIYSKTYCPYCTRVKDLMTDLKVPAKVLELDTMGGETPALMFSLCVCHSIGSRAKNTGQHLSHACLLVIPSTSLTFLAAAACCRRGR